MEHGAGHMALAGYCRPPSSGGLYGVVGPGGALSARNALAAAALLANGAVGPLALRGVFFGEGGARTRTLLWASAALLAAFVLLAEGGGGQLVPRAAALLHLLHLPLLAATHIPAAAASGGSALALVSAAGGARGAASGCCVGLVASLYGRGAARAFVLAQRWLAVYGAGFVLPWMGVWAFLECPGHGLGFFGDEIGHIIPVSCIGLGAVVSLLFTGVGHSHAQRVALQRVEGRLTFVLGAIFLAEHTAGQKGGVFYPLLFGHTSPDWMKNQQHTFDGLAWLACGALALVCAAKNLATGLHFLVPALLNVHMMFSHPQHCAHESWGHWLNALALAVGALFRACNRPAPPRRVDVLRAAVGDALRGRLAVRGGVVGGQRHRGGAGAPPGRRERAAVVLPRVAVGAARAEPPRAAGEGQPQGGLQGERRGVRARRRGRRRRGVSERCSGLREVMCSKYFEST